ncbi:hypothetical protein BB561_006360 [Smittium simulii]|uniref:Chromo domain-containing protein n=1 Tax=Smittium simulii TaxID=133385 RepID=A0A2T9Y4W8_9FUNG|nr:hypothetical protein BB561_006360 [Smittium simulii]
MSSSSLILKFVSEILDSKLYYNKLYYLLEWKEYTPSNRLWEPTKNLRCFKLISQSHQNYSVKSRHSLRPCNESASRDTVIEHLNTTITTKIPLFLPVYLT